MKVMIVDDETAGRRALVDGCRAYADLMIVGEFADPYEALDAMRTDVPDVLFLDIRMATMSGLELARALDPARLPIIVFVTAFDEYAVEAFEISATDYLLKPFDDERFAKTIERVRQRYREESGADRETAFRSLLERLERTGDDGLQRRRVLGESGGRFHLLDVADIELVEASRNYVKMTVGRTTYHARSTMQQAEQALASEPILRISRSSLVNTRHVREIHRTPRGDFILVLTGGTTITSSEGRREAVREYLETLRMAAPGRG
jgi:two-component system, LytTR family, response regulator